MKMPLLVAFLCAATAAASAQSAPPSRPSAVVHHQVSAVAAAQAAFDRGLLDYYAYNPEAAEHEFYTAADLDPHLAMAYWGIALSNAPNLNVPATDDRDEQARHAIERAKAFESGASEEDRALIDAAAARFDDSTKAKYDVLLANYRDALKRVAAEYTDDPDAAALYAESALYVAVGHPRQRFDAMTPQRRAEFTAGVAALLPYFQASLAKFPRHVGLLHFYIHAAQMAGTSASAVNAAKQLAAFSLPPEDSHLTHMPGHTFFDVGMYEEALDVGQRSYDMDLAAFACCHPGYYSAPRYYHDHNTSFLLYAMTQTGHAKESVAIARATGDPAFEARQLVAAGEWQAVLDLPRDESKNPTVPFARGVAAFKTGNAGAALAALAQIPDAPADSPARVATVRAMRLTVESGIASLDRDNAKALDLLAQASAQAGIGDTLGGSEFPSLYYYSPHLALAMLAMQLGKTEVAKAALQAELIASPRSSAAMAALAKLNASR